ncbi:MAG: hypothetical protein NC181_00210 [Clostridium sp.]|nr:hypothetical protein [Clostridium sp.]MCM1443901.1 hypothetical protein [Candidatus Amulumruptor caecigallinarius]
MLAFPFCFSKTNQKGNKHKLEYCETLDKDYMTGDYTDFVKLITGLEIEMLNKYLELL